MVDGDAACLRWMARQHGLVSREQALGAGLDARAVTWRLEQRAWRSICRGVYALNGAPRSWHQQLMAACLSLGADAVVSHSAAAALWEMEGFRQQGVVVSVPRSRRHRIDGMEIHRGAQVSQKDRVLFRGIPTTSASRTLLDLAATESVKRVETALEHCLRRRWVSLDALESATKEPSRGRPGMAMMRRLLRAHGRGATESSLEVRFLQFVRESTLPPPQLQHVVRDSGRFVARLDFAYPERKVAIETDGRSTHSRREQFSKDHERRNRLQALGWRVLVVTHEQLKDDAAAVEAAIARAIGLRLATKTPS